MLFNIIALQESFHCLFAFKFKYQFYRNIPHVGTSYTQCHTESTS